MLIDHPFLSMIIDEASDEWFSWFSEGKSDLDLNDVELKVIVPQGLVAAVSKSNPSHILWRHKVRTTGVSLLCYLERARSIKTMQLFLYSETSSFIPYMQPLWPKRWSHLKEDRTTVQYC